MNRYDTKNLVIQNICLLIPLILYSLYKNGYLIYEKNLVSFINIFKPLYLVLIGILIKIIIDLVRYKKINIDYELLYVILVGMIMPYNTSYLIYIISFIIIYIITLFIDKFVKYNKVCFIYLIIIMINFIFNKYTFLTPLDENYTFSFTFLDLLIGRNIGGIASTSILFSLTAYIILLNNYYYKKDIPFTINITYLSCMLIYYLITRNSDLILNSELIFGSVFVASLPMSSPYKEKTQIIESIIIGILTFTLSIYFNSIIAIYISIFVMSLIPNIKWFKFR